MATVQAAGRGHYGFSHQLGRWLQQAAAGLGALGLAATFGSAASAQGAMVGSTNVVVTGFSGAVEGPPPPPGGDPFDTWTIDINGPSLRVLDVSNLGPQGSLSTAPATYTATAGQIGQVFGVAIDDAPQPNIYAAASSIYGLSIFVPDEAGSVLRTRRGGPNAQFLPGQFGPPDFGGGPGSIWRIDGATGQVTPFASLPNASQSVAALGGLAYDRATHQLFVVERGSGEIHRFGLDGTDREAYDHGAQGRPAAGLAPIPAGGTPVVNITDPGFDTQNPATWGLAQPGRRILGLGFFSGRLFYAVAQGPQIWSVSIRPNGSFGNDARVEVDVTSLASGIEIGQIAFDGQGRMYLAERGATTGDYALVQLADPGQTRVLRYIAKEQGEPGPGRWRPAPEQYSIGMPAPHTNANGGVALGYGYSPNGALNNGQCGATVWSTGERLLDPNTPVEGLQGNAIGLVQPQNVPPVGAWYIDYNETPNDPNYRGYMGALATIPCPGQVGFLPVGPPPPPILTCPPGTFRVGDICQVALSCPTGTIFQDGTCIYRDCPPGTYRQAGRCLPPPQVCPPGTFWYNGRCAPLDCPPGLVRSPNGYCVCPPGLTYYNGRCVPPNNCPPGMVTLPGGICWCPLGTVFDRGVCRPQFCPPGQIRQGDRCVCPPGQIMGFDGRCEPFPCPPGFRRQGNQCVPLCPPGQVMLPSGICIPIFCLQGQHLENGRCVPDRCPPGQFRGPNGICIPIQILCPLGQHVENGRCVPNQCPPGTFRSPNGICIPILILCPQGQHVQNGRCVPDNCPPGQFRGPNGTCIPISILCRQGFHLENGTCVPNACPQGTQRGPNGICLPILGQCPPGQVRQGLQCVPQPCPLGQFRNQQGQCVPLPLQNICPQGQVRQGNQCVPAPCPPGQIRNPQGQCQPLQILPRPCPPGQTRNQQGQCVPTPCPTGQIRNQQGNCVPLQITPPPCPAGQTRNQQGQCVPTPCPTGQIRNQQGQCVPLNLQPICPPGQIRQGNQCVPAPCPPGQRRQGNDCVPIVINPNIGGGARIVEPCPAGQVRNNQGQCVPQPCPGGQIRNQQGQCVPIVNPNLNQGSSEGSRNRNRGEDSCPAGQTRNNQGQCVCLPGRVKNDKGECVVVTR